MELPRRPEALQHGGRVAEHPAELLPRDLRGLGKAFKAGDTVTLTGIPSVVKNAYSADFGGDVVVDDGPGTR